jgi:uncharacterized membrane protein (UPF0127 family)
MKKTAIFLIVILFLSPLLFSAKTYIQVFLPNGDSITAELARTEQERMRGLMSRSGLGRGQGMLFVFEKEGYHSFWMKNMKFAIDIVWLDAQKRIIHIERRVPPCKKDPCPSYLPNLPAMYVLEVKAGSVDERELKLYDRLEFILGKLIGTQ